MRAELVKNGPIAVSFEVYKDFVSYKVIRLRLKFRSIVWFLFREYQRTK